MCGVFGFLQVFSTVATWVKRVWFWCREFRLRFVSGICRGLGSRGGEGWLYGFAIFRVGGFGWRDVCYGVRYFRTFRVVQVTCRCRVRGVGSGGMEFRYFLFSGVS